MGFHAQQAAEKFLKAFLVHSQIEFPKTHNLGELLDLIAPLDAQLAESLRDATALNPYGIEMRYPSDLCEITQERGKAAVELAAKVRDAVLERLGGEEPRG